MGGHERHGQRQLIERDKIPRSIVVWASPIEIVVRIVRPTRLEMVAVGIEVVVTASATIDIILRTGIRMISRRNAP